MTEFKIHASAHHVHCMPKIRADSAENDAHFDVKFSGSNAV